jgi:hypothetical protein
VGGVSPLSTSHLLEVRSASHNTLGDTGGDESSALSNFGSFESYSSPSDEDDSTGLNNTTSNYRNIPKEKSGLLFLLFIMMI